MNTGYWETDEQIAARWKRWTERAELIMAEKEAKASQLSNIQKDNA